MVYLGLAVMLLVSSLLFCWRLYDFVEPFYLLRWPYASFWCKGRRAPPFRRKKSMMHLLVWNKTLVSGGRRDYACQFDLHHLNRDDVFVVSINLRWKPIGTAWKNGLSKLYVTTGVARHLIGTHLTSNPSGCCQVSSAYAIRKTIIYVNYVYPWSLHQFLH